MDTRQAAQRLKENNISIESSKVAELARIGVFDGAFKSEGGVWQIPEESVEMFIKTTQKKKRWVRGLTAGTLLGVLTLVLTLVSAANDWFGILEYIKKGSTDPLFASVSLIEGENILVVERDTVDTANLPYVGNETNEFIKSATYDVSLWPSVSGVWIKLTSPVGKEVIVNNVIGLKTLEFRPLLDSSVSCLYFEEGDGPCVGCGGAAVSHSSLEAITVSTEVGGEVWARHKDSQAPVGYDLSFPHSMQVDLNYAAPGLYKFAILTSYVYEGTERTNVQSLEEYVVLGLPECVEWVFVDDLPLSQSD